MFVDVLLQFIYCPHLFRAVSMISLGKSALGSTKCKLLDDVLFSLWILPLRSAGIEARSVEYQPWRLKRHKTMS